MSTEPNTETEAEDDSPGRGRTDPDALTLAALIRAFERIEPGVRGWFAEYLHRRYCRADSR